MHLQIDLDNTMLAHYTTHLKLLERGKEKEKEKFRGFFQIFLRRHAKMKRHTNHSVPKNNSMKFRIILKKQVVYNLFSCLFCLSHFLKSKTKKEVRFWDEFIIWT